MKNADTHVLLSTERKPLIYPLAVWLGFIVVVGTMAAGGSLTSSLNLHDIVVITLFTNIILGLIAALFGYMGAKTGKSFALLVADAFPGISSKIVALYVPFILVFWFAVVSSILGQYLGATFGFGENATLFLSMFSCFLFSVTSYLGIKSLSIFSTISVPIILILAGYAVFSQTIPASEIGNRLDDWSVVNNTVGLILSTWIMGATINIPDITRFARKPWHGALIGFLGIFVANSFNIIVGARAALIGGTADPAPLLIALGLPLFGFILVITNIWTTNDNNMYSAALGLAHATKSSRKKSVLALATIAAVLTLFKIGTLEYILNGFIIMGATAPALGAVVLSQYLHQRDTLAWKAWVAWFLGALVAYTADGGIGILSGMIVAFVIHRLLNYLSK